MNKLYKEIFKNTCIAAVVAAVLMPLGAFAATGNGCEEDSNNDYINPELALCSTHVYNIGGITNPDNEAQRQVMRDVVALKTTIMTQQMYKQYEYLESMIKRFKTQLEKAVLTTKLQAVGADTTESSSGGSLSFKSSDSNIKLAGAQNCVSTTYQNAYSCLTSNIQLVLNAVNGGNNIGEARRQLEADLGVAVTWGIVCEGKNAKGSYYGRPNSKDNSCGEASLSKCNDSKSNARKWVTECAQQLNAVISTAAYELQSKQNMYNRNNQGQF